MRLHSSLKIHITRIRFTRAQGSIQIQMQCRSGCGACCIAPSISSPIPGMPMGKPAGVRCVQLLADFSCAIFGDPLRPKVCAGLQAMRDMCGDGAAPQAREFALRYLGELEIATAPA